MRHAAHLDAVGLHSLREHVDDLIGHVNAADIIAAGLLAAALEREGDAAVHFDRKAHRIKHIAGALVAAADGGEGLQPVQTRAVKLVKRHAPDALLRKVHADAHGHDMLFRRPMVAAAVHVAGKQRHDAIAVLDAGDGRVEIFAVQHMLDARHQPHGGKRLQVIAEVIGRGMPDYTIMHHSGCLLCA